MRKNLSLENGPAIGRIMRNGKIETGGNVEARSPGEFKHFRHDPRSAMHADIRRGLSGEQNDDGIINDAAGVMQIAVNASAFARLTGEMILQKGEDGGS